MLRGRALYPTAAKQYLDENAATIRWPNTRRVYRQYLRVLQAR